MAAKKTETKKSSKPLFRMEEKGPAADGKGKLYYGYVGGQNIGAVITSTKTAARKKLIAIARKQIK